MKLKRIEAIKRYCKCGIRIRSSNPKHILCGMCIRKLKEQQKVNWMITRQEEQELIEMREASFREMEEGKYIEFDSIDDVHKFFNVK